MKLFYAPGSSSLLPHIVFCEAELPFEPVKIDEHTKAISGGGDYGCQNGPSTVEVLLILARRAEPDVGW
jgi:glutathione S-transferase